MPTIGVLIQLAWRNPYTEPPNGMRVLAEVFHLYDAPNSREVPQEFDCLYRLGDGYGNSFTFLSGPVKQQPKEVLASVRKKRVTRRMERKYPLFAGQFIQEEIDKKADYYAGETRADLEAARVAISKSEQERIDFLAQHLDQVIIYGHSHSVDGTFGVFPAIVPIESIGRTY